MNTPITTRRLACSSLAAVLLLTAACSSPFRRMPLSPSQYQDVDTVTRVPQVAGQERFELANFEACGVHQEKPKWCWAACAAMIYKWQGQEVAQADIVDRIRSRAAQEGDDTDPTQAAAEADEERLRAAGEHEILLALAPDRQDLLDQLWDQSFETIGEAIGEQLVAQTDEERAAAE